MASSIENVNREFGKCGLIRFLRVKKTSFMQNRLSKSIPFLVISIGLCIFGIMQTSYADNPETYSLSFDWYGIRLILIVLGILLGGLIIKPIRGFFGAMGGGFVGLFVAAWISNNSPEGFMNFIIMGSMPTAIFGGIVGILAQIHKSSREE
jgi:hypothetical protein